MTEADRIEACTRLLMAAAKTAGMAMSGDGRVSEADAAALLGLAPGTLKNMRTIEGTAPVSYRAPVGGSRVSYRIEGLAAWIEGRRHWTTSKAMDSGRHAAEH